jgi:hypothetical protein
MKHLQRGFTAIELFVVALVLLGVGGWIANIVKLTGMDFGSITGMLIVRAVGIFVAPLGSVMGFL